MRPIVALLALALAACAADTSLVVEQKDDSVTVRVPDGDTAAANRAAQQVCAAQRKRAVLAGLSSERMRFVCQTW